MVTERIFTCLLTAACWASLFQFARGQEESCTRVYVDPDNGSNATGTGLIGSPFKTITHAIDYIDSLTPVGQPNRGTVVLLPGRYTWAQEDPNNSGPEVEVWPIAMQTGISLQGTNALNTIIEGPGPGFVLDPSLPQTPNRLLDFHESGGDFSNTFVNGISIRNALHGVVIQGFDEALEPSLSNCFIFENCIGVVISSGVGSPLPEDDLDGDGQPEHRPTILHCTISDNQIGVWDGALNTQTGSGLVGTAFSAIVNSLIFDNLRADLQGVDQDDLLGSAFFQAQVIVQPGETSLCGLGFPSVPGGLLPDNTPDGDPSDSVADLSLETQESIYVSSGTGDYRLLPRAGATSNPLRGTGNPGVETLNGLEWTVGNGTTTATGPGPLGYCGPDGRVVDAEGHGNPRYELDYDNPLPPPDDDEFPIRVDVGADEMGQFIVFGYNALTTTIVGGTTPFAYMTPNPALLGTVRRARHYKAEAGTGYLNMQPFVTPGIHPDGTFPCIPRAIPGQQCESEFCIDQTTLLPGFPTMMTMDLKGIATTLPQEAPGPPTIRVNYEIVPRNGGQGTTCLSNLQSYTVE